MTLTPNLPLLRKALDWAELEAKKPRRESQWNQAMWLSETDCGTAYCIAGYVAHITADINRDDGIGMTTLSGVLIPRHATRELGLTNGEAAQLFMASNSIADLRMIAEDIAERAGEEL